MQEVREVTIPGVKLRNCEGGVERKESESRIKWKKINFTPKEKNKQKIERSEQKKNALKILRRHTRLLFSLKRFQISQYFNIKRVTSSFS